MVKGRSRLVRCFAVGIFWLIGLSQPASALEDKDFSSWTKYTKGELIAETTGLAPGQSGAIGLKISLVEKWHTYWLNPGDSGAPIRLNFKTDPGVSIKQVLFPTPVREMTGPIVSFAYKDQVLLPIELAVSDQMRVGTSTRIEVDAEWLVCADVCIPALQKFNIDVPIMSLTDIKPTAEFALFQQTRRLIPKIVSPYPKFEKSDGAITLKLPDGVEPKSVVEFFPFSGSGVTNEPVSVLGQTLQFKASVTPVKGPERVGILLVSGDSQQALQFGDSGWTFGKEEAASGSKLWWMMLSAFLGGVILNLMPCVFPILSMKFLSLMKLGQAHSKDVRAQNLAYVAGVLLTFLGIAGLLAALRGAGQLVGWGFQLQSPVFLLLLIWLFVALTLNLLGLFAIDFIDSGLGTRLTRAGGLSGSFFTGVLAVVVASPCTAPFMGAALGFGISQPLPQLLLIFGLLGLGLASPYLIFAVFPAWTRFLPRPGLWMERLKQVMALPMLLTAVWLVWVLSQFGQIQIVYGVLLTSALLVMALWYRGQFHLGLKIFTALAMGGVLVTALALPEGQRDLEANDGVWQPYSEARLESLKGQNVFLNMTADWCLTCKVNERLVFNDPEVLARLESKGVVMLKGDWTQRDEEITRFLNRYQRVGVPFYVMYSAKNPSGVALPEVLTKSSFLDWIETEYK